MQQFYIKNEKIEFLKYIAIIFMILDHYSSLFLESYNLLKILGRFVFPLFTIILVYNYIYNTKDKFIYIQRLFIFALISEPFHYYAFKDYYNGYVLNIFFTLATGLLIIYIYEKNLTRNLFNKLLIYFYLVLFLPFYTFLSYGIYGVLLILMVYLFMKKTNYITLILLVLIIYLNNFNWHYLYSIFGVFSLFLVYYSPFIEVKRINKYVFYIIYPLHLLILILILKF